MDIITTRRICQAFFLLLFFWFCLVATLGEAFWQLRGWPVNWFLELDPLVALGTLITTGTVYAGLLWALLPVMLTVLLGRFFCGWVCPFGTLNHFIGYLAHRGRRTVEKTALNRPRSGQRIKYWILFYLLAVAGADFFGLLPLKERGLGVSLQTGLLDPISLMTRSVNLLLIPLLDGLPIHFSISQRYYEGAWAIGFLFLTLLSLNLLFPRFYCRFLCPLGALFGLLSRFAIWRIGKQTAGCGKCNLCDRDCEGACAPSGEIRIAECVLCMNCRNGCPHNRIRYQIPVSASGELPGPDLARRGVLLSLASGVVTVPLLGLDAGISTNWNPQVIRPPGALDEARFLGRCLKCGQCMRVCPTNVIQPAVFQAGIEGLWSPVLNFRIGTSGCQHNCIACGQICPTSAIRPLSPDERMGRNDYKEQGAIRIGTAFIDRGRCLPWAMNRPCIVCQENCPVSPKAIYTLESFVPVRMDHPLTIVETTSTRLRFAPDGQGFQEWGSGDYFCRLKGIRSQSPRRIIESGPGFIRFSAGGGWVSEPKKDTLIEILIRLQQPVMDPKRCIGCGVCEHECPVKGQRAIRVTAENESRERRHLMLLP